MSAERARQETARFAGLRPVDSIVTHHRDGYRSGVARFNELLAGTLGIPLLGLLDEGGLDRACPLLSFKVGELGPDERVAIERQLDQTNWCWELFVHELADDPLEERLIRRAQRVHCGNEEILDRVQGLTRSAGAAWTPGLLLDDRHFRPAEVTVFSFGMAHKLQTGFFNRLRDLLQASGRDYAVYVSAANHETASIRDAEIVLHDMHEIFGGSLFFLGNLSDVAVANHLRRATFFAAFFPSGVRANNTSVASALERGCVVITNLDRHSPGEFVHMETVVDINRCDELPSDSLTLARIRYQAMAVGQQRSWNRLAEHLGFDASLTEPNLTEP